MWGGAFGRLQIREQCHDYLPRERDLAQDIMLR